MIKLKDALKLCPHLKVIHVATYKEGDAQPAYWDDIDTNTHKVSLDFYRRESVRIAARFKASLPTSVEIGVYCIIILTCFERRALLEKASIDEAFFDYTKAVKEILLQRFPYLAQVPKDAEHGIDTPLPPPPQLNWAELGAAHVIPLHHLPSEEENKVENEQTLGSGASDSDERENNGETSGASEKWHGTELNEEEQCTATWHDVALSIAAELMNEARAQVREMGYTTSAVSVQL
jgi:DNA polymerase eta